MPLALLPGKTRRLPTCNGPAMSLVVERSFEAASDVMTITETRRCHRPGRSHAPAPRTANEVEVIIQLDTERLELTGQALGKTRVDRLIWERLPLNEDSPLPQRPEVRNADIGPFRARADINQLRPRTRLKRLPRCRYVNVVDRFIAILLAQKMLPPESTG